MGRLLGWGETCGEKRPSQKGSDGDLSYGSTCSAEGRARAQGNWRVNGSYLFTHSTNFGERVLVLFQIFISHDSSQLRGTLFPPKLSSAHSKAVIHN